MIRSTLTRFFRFSAALALVTGTGFIATGTDAVQAQPHAGGILVGGGYPVNSTAYLNGLFEINRTNGTLTTFVDTFAPTRPNYFQQTVMDRDNQSIAFVTRGSSSAQYSHSFGLFSYDPSTKTYATLAQDPKAFANLYGVTIGQDGEYYISGYGYDAANAAQDRIYRVDAPGQWTTLLTTQRLGHTERFRYATVRDVDTGDLLIAGNANLGFVQRLVYSVSGDGTVATWHMSSTGPTPTYGMTQEIATGDLIYMNGSVMYRAAQGRQPTARAPITSLTRSCYGCVFENQSVQNARLISYSYTTSANTIAALEYIDLKTETVTQTVKIVDAPSQVQVPYPQRNALNANARYLQTVKAGNRTWDLNISAPAFPGKNYVIAASFSGIRPGIPISGRKIWLNLDALTPLVVDNRIPTVFNPGPLTLDANGRAKGKVNARFMPANVNLNIHMVLAVLDRAAPQGIAFISEPVPLRL